jgi:hypothetical protein
MMKTPAICAHCKKPYLRHVDDTENACSECKVDEALHGYLRAIRRKDGRLSFFEWLILNIKG